MKTKTNEEIDDMIKQYIYESPDGGETVYRRESGSSDRELVKESKIYVDMSDSVTMNSMGNPSDYSDLISDGNDVIDLSGLLTSASPSTISITADHEYDTTFDIYDTEKRLSAIEKRLAILEPKKHLLDKYEVLQGLYEQYKAAEAMLYEDEDEEEELPF